MVPEGGSDSIDHQSDSPGESADNLVGSVTAQSHVSSTRTASSSPWAQIVRGEPESRSSSQVPTTTTMARIDQSSSAAASSSPTPSTSAEKESSSNDSGSNSNAAKNPAWNKPCNKAGDVGPVMGAESWPALSESTRAPSNKSSSSESLKGLSDGSISEPMMQSAGASSFTQRPVGINANDNSTPAHTMPSRQRLYKRNGSTSSSNGGSPYQVHQITSQGSTAEAPGNNLSSRDQNPRGGSSPQPQVNNDHQQQRNSFRNRSGGSRPRGDGNYGGRRSQEHGNQNWHSHRNYGGRDMHTQSQRGFPRFPRNPPPPPPPPTSAHFIGGPSIRPFGSHISSFPDFIPPVYYAPVPPPPPPPPATPDSLRGVPMVAPFLPPPMFVPVYDPVYLSLWNQISYYFSDENLIKDDFLREQMDEHGWLPVTLIAGFNRVKQITENIQLVLDVAQKIPNLEVKGDKLRRRGDWWKWPIKSSARERNDQDTLVNGVQDIALDQNSSGESSSAGNNQQVLEASGSMNGGSQPKDTTG